jgi:hypothetical protein
VAEHEILKSVGKIKKSKREKASERESLLFLPFFMGKIKNRGMIRTYFFLFLFVLTKKGHAQVSAQIEGSKSAYV